MNNLVYQANRLLSGHGFEYAFCGGFAIDLFLGYESRPHGDIDITAYWQDRDIIIKHMQSLGYDVYEIIGGGKGHHITDINTQYRLKNNIFCCKKDCTLPKFTKTEEDDIYIIDVLDIYQSELDFLEFIFNHKNDTHFIYSRNSRIRHSLDDAVLYNNGVPYLAPEICLLYKSTSVDRPGYRQDYKLAAKAMNQRQKKWLNDALKTANPKGHIWIDG